MDAFYDHLTVKALTLSGDSDPDAVTVVGAASLQAAAGGGGGASPNQYVAYDVGETAAPPAVLEFLPMATFPAPTYIFGTDLSVDGSGKLLVATTGLYHLAFEAAVTFDPVVTVPASALMVLTGTTVLPFYGSGPTVQEADPSTAAVPAQALGSWVLNLTAGDVLFLSLTSLSHAITDAGVVVTVIKLS